MKLHKYVLNVRFTTVNFGYAQISSCIGNQMLGFDENLL